jgi:hypothetical protein
MRKFIPYAIGLTALSFSVISLAQPIVYPAKGQSPEQQNRDDAECYTWAKQNTGIDPAVVASTPPAQQSGPAVGGGERARGALRGAVGGAVIGEIANDDAGKGAGIGAVVGVMAGGRQARQNQQAQNQQAQAQQQQMINTFYRAYGACLEGRGYTVK